MPKEYTAKIRVKNHCAHPPSLSPAEGIEDLFGEGFVLCHLRDADDDGLAVFVGAEGVGGDW